MYIQWNIQQPFSKKFPRVTKRTPHLPIEYKISVLSVFSDQ